MTDLRRAQGEEMSKIIQSYVWHGDKCVFVSTINRSSSSPLAGPEPYAETMVWEWDEATRERGKLIAQESGSKGSMYQHFAFCRRFVETGEL